ncbi:MAG TPA: phosphate ABC transporter permease subunit PstC [Thermoanaerobaculia bacterium]
MSPASIRPWQGGRRRVEWLRRACYGASSLAALAFAGLLALLVVESLPVWRAEGVAGFLLGERWFFRAGEFGALPMLFGTAAVSGVALALAAPVGVGAALFVAEVLPLVSDRARLAAKTAIELLAGVPSVVYGLLGVLLLRDRVFDGLRWAGLEPLSGDTLLTGGVLLAVMILPTVVTFSEDALRGVPGADRRAARGLGLTRARTVLAVVLPRALPGIGAALLLALGRALGETIAVFLVVGRRDNQLPVSLAPTDVARALASGGQTITSKLGGAETFIAYGDPLHWGAILGLAVVLLAVVAGLTLASARMLRRRGGAI